MYCNKLFLGINAYLGHIYYFILRLWGEKVNLREQHDAFEFFNCLLDSLDEGMKGYNYPTPVSGVLGGSFTDQKICQGCPHRYIIHIARIERGIITKGILAFLDVGPGHFCPL